jgi:DNA repair exonuclease SbcCD ATPase subunit
MGSLSTAAESVSLRVRNIGGIDETQVTVDPGVTVLVGRNATNRTSFLQSVMAAMGSNDVSIKGDAEEARVECTVGEETYERTLRRTDGGIRASGDAYLDDPDVADLFAFLLESNEARRAVASGDDLHELIMRPIDTAEIRAEIRRCEQERDRIDDELAELEELKGELPPLEERRARLETDIEEKKARLRETEADIEAYETDTGERRDEQERLEERLADLRSKRGDLEEVRSDIEMHEESVESLQNERRDLEAELDDLPDDGERNSDLDAEISRLRDRTRRLETEVTDLQDAIQFNEEMLDGTDGVVSDAIGDGQEVTDRLVGDTVTCWTCGSSVASERIETTLDRLRETRQAKLDTLDDLEDELERLETERREQRRTRRRRETAEENLAAVEAELEERRETLDSLRTERDRLRDDIEATETEIEDLETASFDEVLDLHRAANDLEFELGRLESELDDVTDRIRTIETRLDEERTLQERRAELQDELTDLRSCIDRTEQQAVDAFNRHMEAVLDALGYGNLERIWIERVVAEGREADQRSFTLHVVRSTASGAVYEDTVDHLSESEREVTGLVFALAGYLVHDVHETVPFMLLDSLEAIDSERLADLVDYLSDYPPFLVVALLPEDARVLDDDYARISDI